MAAAIKQKFTLNGKPISEKEASDCIVAIYGERRLPEILSGIADGTYGCASVADGHIELQKEEISQTPT